MVVETGRLLGVKWSGRYVLQLDVEDKATINSTKSRKRKWTWHVLRHNGMFRDVTEGRLVRKKDQQEDDATR